MARWNWCRECEKALNRRFLWSGFYFAKAGAKLKLGFGQACDRRAEHARRCSGKLAEDPREMALIIKAESNAMELKGRSELSVDVFARPHQRPQVGEEVARQNAQWRMPAPRHVTVKFTRLRREG
jgi:hypothetical protein